MIQESARPGTYIETILATPGRQWDPTERNAVLDWLLILDPFDLALCAESFFRKKWPGIPTQHAVDIFNLFLGNRLELLLTRYNPAQGNLKTYLRFCLLRHCKTFANKFWKDRKKDQLLFSSESELEISKAPDVSVYGNPEQYLVQQELLQAVEQSVADLPQQYRQALMMFLDEKNYQVIAQELGVSIAVVKNRIHRARQRLRLDLQQIRSDYGF